MRTYVHEYGIGPWEIYEFNPDTVTPQTIRSNTVPNQTGGSARRSVATVISHLPVLTSVLGRDPSRIGADADHKYGFPAPLAYAASADAGIQLLEVGGRRTSGLR